MSKKNSKNNAKSKNITVLIFSSFAIIFLLSILIAYNFYVKDLHENDIIAVFDGGKVSRKDFQDEIEAISLQNPVANELKYDELSADQKKLIIEQIVIKKIIHDIALKKGYNQDKKYHAAMRSFKTEFLRKRLYTDIAHEAQKEQNLRKKYDEFLKQMKNKVDFDISYITLATKEKADHIYEKLSKNPSEFAKYAMEESLDKETAQKGGKLGFVNEDSLPLEVKRAIKNIFHGNIAKPAKFNDEWVIVKLENTRPAQALSFEDAKSILLKTVGSKAIDDFVHQKLAKANIKFTN